MFLPFLSERVTEKKGEEEREGRRGKKREREKPLLYSHMAPTARVEPG